MQELLDHPELDKYDETMLDEETYDHISADQRRKAEQAIKRREQQIKRKAKERDASRGRVPSALETFSDCMQPLLLY